MKKLVTTALALVAAGSAANAGSSDNEWLALDGEIKNLASSLSPSREGMGWSALIRTAFTYGRGDVVENTNPNGEKIDGFNFQDVDFAVWGSQGDYGWRISTDALPASTPGSSSFNIIQLEDAYVWWHCGDYFTTTMGSQRPHFVRSGYIDPEQTLFIDRSAIGASFDFRDLGIQGNGSYDAFDWYVGLFDGQDGNTVDHSYYFRGEWRLGAGAGMGEGALGGNDDVNATIGLGYVQDDTNDTGNSDTNAWVLDLAGSMGQFGFGAEYTSLGEDALAATSSDYLNGAGLVLEGDSSPWDLWASWLLNPEWEVGVRYEDLDNGQTAAGVDSNDNKLFSVVAAYYQAGNKAKWQAEWTSVDAGSGFPDGSIVQVGLSVGMTR